MATGPGGAEGQGAGAAFAVGVGPTWIDQFPQTAVSLEAYLSG